MHDDLMHDLAAYLEDVATTYMKPGTGGIWHAVIRRAALFTLRRLIRKARAAAASGTSEAGRVSLLWRVFQSYWVLRSTVPLHERHPRLAAAMADTGQRLFEDRDTATRHALGATLRLCSADPKALVTDPALAELVAPLSRRHQYVLGVEGLAARDCLEPARECPFAPEPNRIAYLVTMSLPYNTSGYSSRTEGVALAFAGNDVQVDVVSRPGFPSDLKLRRLMRKPVPGVETHNGVTYHRIFEPANTRFSFTPYAAAAADAFEAKLRDIKPAHVIAASNFRNALPALIAARRLGLPFAYEVRGMWELTRAAENPGFEHTRLFAAQQALETFICVHADRVLTLTEPMLEDLVSRGVDRDRIALMPNGVSPQMLATAERDETLAAGLGIPEGRVVIGYAGAFKGYEGLPDLAQAAAGLAARGHDICLLILGKEKPDPTRGTPITDEIRRVFETVGHPDRLIMAGRVPFAQIRRYYALMDICPITRRPYAISQMVSPIKPVEAMAQGKAVVLSDVAAMNYFAQGETTALRFRAGDAADLEQKLARLVESPDLRTEFGTRARHFIETTLQWPQVCARAARHIGLGSDTDEH